MEDVIAPISKELLKAELTEEKRLRMTNRSHNQIYIITAQDSPNTMKEIGRLREIAFRAAGGGTGKSMDIDEYDIMDNPYKQLIVWNPEAEEILGGYRYILDRRCRHLVSANGYGWHNFNYKLLITIYFFYLELQMYAII